MSHSIHIYNYKDKHNERFQDHFDFLRKVDCFDKIPDSVLENLTENLVETNYARGDIILNEGDISNQLYVIKSGSVMINKFLSENPHDCKITSLIQGDIFGELSWLDHEPSSATVEAIEDTTILAIAASNLDAKIKHFIDEGLVLTLCRRIRAANENILLLAALCNKDELTGIPNRRYFRHIYLEEWARACRQQTGNRNLSIIMFDIDNFKLYNDTYGHQSGDVCLKRIGAVLRRNLNRVTDFYGRYGGEEFIILLANTNEDSAINVAEKLRVDIERLALPNAQSIETDRRVTISLGVSTCQADKNLNPMKLINVSDQALYEAKTMGKNIVAFKSIE
ncbi:MAG: GGDEF domain-containing protein [Pseudomonadota bacterium]